MNGVIYCRVSSKEQIEGTSLASQESACRDYARTHNIEILRVFVEQGESAKFADRTQLIELINFCRDNRGKVQLVLVWKVDRFARNVGDHFNVKATLKKYGVGVVSVTEPIDSNPEGKLLETILAGFAQFDNDIRAMRTVQGMKRKIQEGIMPWHPPLGYRGVTTSGEKKTKPDEPDQPLFGLLQRAWKEFATGAYTKADMLRLMKSWGVSTRTGEALTKQSLDNFFANPSYAGILVDPWSGTEHEGAHIPMVTKDEFDRVQQIIHKRNHKVPHQKMRPEFPLRGSVRCPACRTYLTASFTRGRSARYPYYSCHHTTCDSGSYYRAAVVHDEFRSFLISIAPKPALVRKLGGLVMQEAKEQLASSKANHTRQKVRAEQIERQMRELITMRANRLISDAEFVTYKTTLDEQRLTLESAPPKQRIDVETIQDQLEKVCEPLERLPETWQALPTAFQQRFQRIVLPVGYVQGKIGTADLGLLFSTFAALENTKTHVVPPAGQSWNQIFVEMTAFAGLLEHASQEIGA